MPTLFSKVFLSLGMQIIIAILFIKNLLEIDQALSCQFIISSNDDKLRNIKSQNVKFINTPTICTKILKSHSLGFQSA